jgi:predicted dehydrogenase
MIKVGIVGFGFMGRKHFRCWKALEDVEIASVCETNSQIAEGLKKEKGNIEKNEESIDLRAVKIYTDIDKMLNEEKLDAVSITLPTYLHAEYSIKALSKGIHVLCEKPMALNVEDCERMISKADRSRKVLQIGHCIRFWPEYAKAKEIIDTGRYGKVIAASFQRLGSTPTWSSDNWLLNEKLSGGVALDLHIHDTDFVQYLFGMPDSVYSSGAEDSQGNLVHIATQYHYKNKLVIAEGGWSMMPSFSFQMSFNIAMEKATLVYDLTRKPTFRLCPCDEEALTPQLQEGDGWLLEVEHFAKAIRGEKVEPINTLAQSMNSVRIVQAEKKSIIRNEVVRIES